MKKLTFLGAGSSVFVENVLGDSMKMDGLKDFEFALFDIDAKRMDLSYRLLEKYNNDTGNNVTIKAYTDPKEAFRGSKYIINAIQVGGYEPSTVIDFEIPKKYGLRQTIGDTLGIGGIFRGLRTAPVLLEYAKIMEEVSPDAWLLNYTNPMSILTGALLRGTEIKTVGLCHSVQMCAYDLLYKLNMETENIQWKVAGINHMGWLLEITRDGKDLYPEIKKRALKRETPHDDMVRYEIMKAFGYYNTESSEHTAEYHPYFIKDKYPELIKDLNIPLDEYPRRCIKHIQKWETIEKELLDGSRKRKHKKSAEYAAYIMNAMETDIPFKFGGNVINKGIIPNLDSRACVEVPCIADRSGITPCYVGELPTQLAALNTSHINVHLLTIEAALTRKKEYIYQAALLDPHTRSELSINNIKALCDEMIEAHGDYLPEYK